MPRKTRAAFTLIELLVVIAIIVILIGVLLPALRKARISAQRTLCASRLHELTAACTMYLDEYHEYPQAGVIAEQQGAVPQIVPIRLLNQLHVYLGFPEISATMPLEQFPPIVLCPFRQEDAPPTLAQQIPLPSESFGLTGYQNTAGLEASSNTDGVVLDPTHCVDARGRHRGGIWSDALDWYSGTGLNILPPGPPVWAYFHFTRNVPFVGAGMADLSAFAGQHRAWSDGSVEWIGPTMINTNPAQAEMHAAYRLGKAGAIAYFWF